MDRASVLQFAAKANIKIDLAVSNRKWLNGSCPLAQWTHPSRQDNSPSFGITVADDKNSRSSFQCFACHHKGSFAKLLLMLGHYRKDNAIKKLAEQVEIAEWDIAKQLPAFDAVRERNAQNKTVRAKPRRGAFPLAVNRPESLRYLQKRRIGYYAGFSLGLRYDEHRKRILFPVHYPEGAFAGYTGRLIDDSLLARDNPKVRDYKGLDKRSVLLCRRNMVRSLAFHWSGNPSFNSYRRAIILVEGLFDYARLCSLGFGRVAALLGSTLTEEKARIIEEWNCPVIWMTDPDEAGRSCLYGLYNKVYDMREGGALEMLNKCVPQFTVHYHRKVDPGRLNFADVCKMLKSAKLYTG